MSGTATPTRMTPAAYLASIGAKPKKPRFLNKKVIVIDRELGEIKLDSKWEAKRWAELRMLQELGEIADLQRQVRYPLAVNGDHICDWIPDFRYRRIRDGMIVVEDAKSPRTRTQPDYRIKVKLFQAIYRGVEVAEHVEKKRGKKWKR